MKDKKSIEVKIENFISWLKNPRFQHDEEDIRHILKRLLTDDKKA